MAWGYHGAASSMPGTAGGWMMGPESRHNKSPEHYSPYIKSEEEIKQEILRDRHKQLYGTGSSGFTGSMPSTLKGVNDTLNTGSTLNSIINFIQGRVGNATANINVPGRRINVNMPLLNAGGGLISGQGSWSPYGNNYLGFQYRKDW